MNTNRELADALLMAAKLLTDAAEAAAAGELGTANDGWLDAMDMLEALDRDSR